MAKSLQKILHRKRSSQPIPDDIVELLADLQDVTISALNPELTREDVVKKLKFMARILDDESYLKARELKAVS
jgi:hypothetical protein